jgi:hypothetical protein
MEDIVGNPRGYENLNQIPTLQGKRARKKEMLNSLFHLMIAKHTIYLRVKYMVGP